MNSADDTSEYKQSVRSGTTFANAGLDDSAWHEQSPLGRSLKQIHEKLDSFCRGQERLAEASERNGRRRTTVLNQTRDSAHAGRISVVGMANGGMRHSQEQRESRFSGPSSLCDISFRHKAGDFIYVTRSSGSSGKQCRIKANPWSQMVDGATKTSEFHLKLRQTPDTNLSRRTKGGFMFLPSVTYNSGGGSGGCRSRTLSKDFAKSSTLTGLGSLNSIGSVAMTTWKFFIAMFPVMPSSRIALASDILSMVFLLYDCVMMPYLLTWNIDIEDFFLCMALIVAMFWALDMALHFLKSFTRDGEIVTDFKQIAIHYLTGRFALDLFILACDWIGIVFDITKKRESYYKFAKFARILKVSRILRLLTLWKSGRVSLLQDLLSQKMFGDNMPKWIAFVGNLFTLVLLIVFFNHIASCMFVAMLASSWRDTEYGWELSISQMHGGTTFRDAGLSNAFQYFIAYYWAISTMFSGSSFLTPMSTLESVWAAGYVLFGVLFGSVMISSMAAMLMESNEANRERNQSLKMLRRYLHQEQIDSMKSLVIMRQASQRMTKNKRIAEKDISHCLDLLAPELREGLRFKIWCPVLLAHPLWRACAYVDDQLIKNLCKNALSKHTFAPGTLIFEEGISMCESLILIWGSMHYTLDEMLAFDTGSNTGHTSSFRRSACTADMTFGRSDEKTSVTEEPSDRVAPTDDWANGFDQDDTEKVSVNLGQHVCEAALWSEWVTVGVLETTSHGEYLSIHSKGVLEVLVSSNWRAQLIMRRFAAALVKFIEYDSPLGLSDLSSAVDYDVVVSAMPEDSRIAMSLPLLKALKMKDPSLKGLWRELENEIYSGICGLGTTESGQVFRTVKVVSMKLGRFDGRFCLKLGEFSDNDNIRVQIDWPCGTVSPRDKIVNRTKELLEDNFPNWESGVQFQHYHVESILGKSVTYGLQTKYLRTVVHAYCSMRKPFMEVKWDDDLLECFMCNKGDEGFRVFAWMTQSQYESILAMDTDDGELLVSQWIADLQEWSATAEDCESPGSHTSSACLMSASSASESPLLANVNIGEDHPNRSPDPPIRLSMPAIGEERPSETISTRPGDVPLNLYIEAYKDDRGTSVLIL